VRSVLENKLEKESAIKVMYITKTIFNNLTKQLNSEQ